MKSDSLPGVFRNYQRRLTRIERYVLRRTLFAVGGALAILAAVIMLIDFVEISRTVGVRSQTSALDVFGLTLMKSPNVILLLLPFSFLFGVLAAFVNFNRRSELIAMRAAGVSAWRFIFPAAGAAFLIGVLTILALNPAASWLDGRFERLSAALTSDYLPAAKQPGETWLRQGDGRTQVVIHARSRQSPGDRLQDVSMFVYTINNQGRLNFQRRIEAREAVLRPGFWQLYGAREAAAGQQAVYYDTLSIPSTLDPSTAYQEFDQPQSVPFWALPGVIQRIEGAGFSATSYKLKFHQLLATPILFAAMSILGAAFSLRLMRLGGLALLAGSGVALGFVFFFFNELCGALGKAEIVPAVLAGWTPPLLALLSGFTLLTYTEDG
ncbi:LPS export ABC transporter permease LptG [Caulobacter sp. 17J80-11]|uniref:LPS export ABC transporter permease LptG n=1 Tax=Caulobacter sp. 17J80-11 TaxID=2763502 RepID=UPI00165369B0|nr:LPS export ABC transporter permease LptG [Caulobacter sp. 17J80-11]MBC6983026.1 LPS export ABC transporter permease LptG [Caulobacter sp. 17J80-11]